MNLEKSETAMEIKESDHNKDVTMAQTKTENAAKKPVPKTLGRKLFSRKDNGKTSKRGATKRQTSTKGKSEHAFRQLTKHLAEGTLVAVKHVYKLKDNLFVTVKKMNI